MVIGWLILVLCVITIDAGHFNGGTIRWVPNNPYESSNVTTISIVQSYMWSYSMISCTTNVPITTAGYTTRNQNLTCVGDCSATGGYSSNPVNTLTDCISTSPATNALISQKSKNVTLTVDAHFALSFIGSAWPNLTRPPDPSSNWSIVVYIDLRKRPDGFINTPPTANVFSPQYAIVNTSISIPIRVADVNLGDDIRCRWATKSISPPIDECGRACYPTSMPIGTTLSNCILNFTGPVANTWYAAAIQVEDFIDTTSNTSMSSIPMEFLIFVQSPPGCSLEPVFIPLTGCLEATRGVSRSFNISVLNRCDSMTNTSFYYKTFTWTPSTAQIGPRQLCMIASTDESVQSAEYCVIFNVITSSPPCATTTTTTTVTTATTKTTSTTTTTETTTTVTTTIVTEGDKSTSTTEKHTSWILIAGISSAILPLALCAFWCVYRSCWKHPAKHRQREETTEDRPAWEYNTLNSSMDSTRQEETSGTLNNSTIEVPKKSYQVFNIASKSNNMDMNSSTIDNRGSILVSMYNNTNGKRSNIVGTREPTESLEMGNAWTQPETNKIVSDNGSMSERSQSVNLRISELMRNTSSRQNFPHTNQTTDEDLLRSSSLPSFALNRDGNTQSRPETSIQTRQQQKPINNSTGAKDWSRIYLFGHDSSKTDIASSQ